MLWDESTGECLAPIRSEQVKAVARFMDCQVHAAAGAKECNVAVGVVCPAVTGDSDDMADLLLSVNSFL